VQIDALIAALNDRQRELYEFAGNERDYKVAVVVVPAGVIHGFHIQNRLFKEQISRCTGKLHHTTGLIQFCIEVLKEQDPVAFLQVYTCKLLVLNVISSGRADVDQPRCEHRVDVVEGNANATGNLDRLRLHTRHASRAFINPFVELCTVERCGGCQSCIYRPV